MRIIIGKCFFSAVLAFLFLIPSVHTQSIIPEQPSWHFLLGGNYISIRRAQDLGDPSEGFDSSPTIGPTLGLGYRHPFPTTGYGEIRLTYLAQKGDFRTAARGHLMGVSNEFDLVTDWLNLSYLLFYQTNGSITLGFEFGPNLSFLLNGGDEVEVLIKRSGFPSPADNGEFQLIEENRTLLQGTMLGFQTGLVVTYPFNESLSGNLSLSYQFGVNNKGNAFFLGESLQFHVFMLAVGIQSAIE
ncbi:MAG: hypothetical protein KTR30_01705 [Saprospiraceae bacterium]|nr:hypothetical protein [Saprospiraceae bacterium]